MREAAVTLHGLWMTGWEMALLRKHLRECGFAVFPFRYPSRSRSPAENAQALARFVDGLDADIVHFVAHSLGGIVLLHYFDEIPFQRPGRVLMLGSPIRGSATARYVATRPFLRWTLGHSIERGLLGDIPTWRQGRPLGMIAGTRIRIGLGVMIGAPLKKPHDGTASLEETRAPWVNRHLSVSCGHFDLLFCHQVADATCHFLHTGAFT